jgi:hypothetical protein
MNTDNFYERMQKAQEVRRANGTSGKARGVTIARRPEGEMKERRDLIKAVALIEKFAGRELMSLVHFTRLDNDELREFIESQFDVLAMGV